MNRQRRATIIVWSCVILAVVFIAARLAIAAATGDRLQTSYGVSLVEIVVVSLVIAALLITWSFWYARSAGRRAVNALRSRYPDAIVLPGVLRTQDRERFRAGAELTKRYKPPQAATAVVTSASVRWFVGRKLRLAASMEVVPGAFRRDELVHNAGVFTALLARSQRDRKTEVPIIPMRNEGFFPRALDRDAFEALLRELQDHRRSAEAESAP